MSSYLGRHAELYDIFYADKPYEDEAAFVHQLIQDHNLTAGNRILEIACGTGSHSFALEALGYEIEATDYSADMLSVARHKALQRKSKVRFRQADMACLGDPEQPFDVVICLFDSIGYVKTNEKLAQVFSRVRQQLRSGGLFIFEYWHAAAMLRGYDPVRVRRWQTSDGELIRISQTRLDCVNQLSHVTYHIYELSAGGCTTLNETQTNRYFLAQEIDHWLTCKGFAPLKRFNGFTTDETINEDTWHIVSLARRHD